MINYSVRKKTTSESVDTSPDELGSESFSLRKKGATPGETERSVEDTIKTTTGEKPEESSQTGFRPSKIKSINRAITRKMPVKEKNKIITERDRLVTKKFKEGLVKKEEKRLTYVRWQLDRIDDAENGEMIDNLEKIVGDHESFADEVKKLMNSLNM